MANELEGRIDVRLTRRDGRVTAVDIRSSRPQLARKLMAGHTPEEAAHLAGLIFSLCGQAQRAAAAAACAAALGRDAHAADVSPVWRELASEHAWRLLLDWPAEARAAPDMASLPRLRQAAPEDFFAVLADLLRDQLLGQPPADWLARDLEGFNTWRQAGATLPARLFRALGDGPDAGQSTAAQLPALAAWDAPMAAALAWSALRQADFCARPDWHGHPAETGALARMHAHPLLAAWIARRGRGMGARLLARLVELAWLADPAWRAGTPPLRAWSIGKDDDGNAVGIAGAETSRGLLFHIACLKDERIVDYRILAPTEWNFHPAGPLVEALSGLPGDAELARGARLVARALDPCVAYGVEVVDA